MDSGCDSLVSVQVPHEYNPLDGVWSQRRELKITQAKKKLSAEEQELPDTLS
jgi:hypothetical protein